MLMKVWSGRSSCCLGKYESVQLRKRTDRLIGEGLWGTGVTAGRSRGHSLAAHSGERVELRPWRLRSERQWWCRSPIRRRFHRWMTHCRFRQHQTLEPATVVSSGAGVAVVATQFQDAGMVELHAPSVAVYGRLLPRSHVSRTVLRNDGPVL